MSGLQGSNLPAKGRVRGCRTVEPREVLLIQLKLLTRPVTGKNVAEVIPEGS